MNKKHPWSSFQPTTTTDEEDLTDLWLNIMPKPLKANNDNGSRGFNGFMAQYYAQALKGQQRQRIKRI